MTRTILVCVLAAACLTACGGASGSSRLSVVASTNVYGDLVRQLGGTRVSVTSILSDPNADPHLFEPGTANGLAVSHADVVVENGLGYDAFMSRLEEAAPNASRRVVTISDVLGIHGADANPHLWYDVPRLGSIATAIVRALAGADAAHAGAYRRDLRTFIASLGPLRRAVAAIRARHTGTPVAYTEPVPGYLVQAAGLRNLAPSSFTRPIQDGTEPPPTAVSALTALVATHRVKLLLYNEQAVSPITARMRDAARRAGVPVVGVTETLPPHTTFQAWQLRQVQALRQALGG